MGSLRRAKSKESGRRELFSKGEWPLERRSNLVAEALRRIDLGNREVRELPNWQSSGEKMDRVHNKVGRGAESELPCRSRSQWKD